MHRVMSEPKMLRCEVCYHEWEWDGETAACPKCRETKELQEATFRALMSVMVDVCPQILEPDDVEGILVEQANLITLRGPNWKRLLREFVEKEKAKKG